MLLSSSTQFPQPHGYEQRQGVEEEIAQAAGAIRNMASTNERRIEFVEAGAAEPLVSIIREMGDVQRGAAAAAVHSLCVENARNRQIIARAGAIAPLVAVIRQAVSDETHDDGGEYEDENGRVRRLVRCTGPNKPSDPTLEYCVSALRELALETKNSEMVGQCGGLKPLLALMSMTQRQETRSLAGNTIVSLAATEKYRDAIGRLGAMPIFLEFVEQGPNVDTLMATCAVKNMLSNNNNKTLFMEHKGLPLLLEIMKDPSATARSQEKCAAALCHLAMVPEYVKPLVDGGTLAVVSAHLHSEDRRLRDACAELVGELGEGVGVDDLIDHVAHPLMYLLGSKLESERIVGARSLAKLALNGAESKVVISQMLVMDAGVAARDRRKTREWKLKRAVKRESAHLQATLRSYRQSVVDAEARKEAAKYEARREFKKIFGPTEIAAYREQFKMIDVDNSGAIDEFEMQALMTSIGLRGKGKKAKAALAKRVRRMIRSVDRDNTGTVDFNEFLQVMRRLHSGWGGSFGRALKRAGKQGKLGASGKAMRYLMGKKRAEAHIQGSLVLAKVRMRKMWVRVESVLGLSGVTAGQGNNVYCVVYWNHRRVGQTPTVENSLDVAWGADHDGDTVQREQTGSSGEVIVGLVPVECDGEAQYFEWLLPMQFDDLEMRVEVRLIHTRHSNPTATH
jgi:hypothetical protein